MWECFSSVYNSISRVCEWWFRIMFLMDPHTFYSPVSRECSRPMILNMQPKQLRGFPRPHSLLSSSQSCSTEQVKSRWGSGHVAGNMWATLGHEFDILFLKPGQCVKIHAKWPKQCRFPAVEHVSLTVGLGNEQTITRWIFSEFTDSADVTWY